MRLGGSRLVSAGPGWAAKRLSTLKPREPPARAVTHVPLGLLGYTAGALSPALSSSGDMVAPQTSPDLGASIPERWLSPSQSGNTMPIPLPFFLSSLSFSSFAFLSRNCAPSAPCKSLHPAPRHKRPRRQTFNRRLSAPTPPFPVLHPSSSRALSLLGPGFSPLAYSWKNRGRPGMLAPPSPHARRGSPLHRGPYLTCG